MKRLLKAESEQGSDIDITPMLDVVFIMLIFFIVTASFVKEAGIGFNVPESISESEPTTQPIVVQVTDLDEIRIQNRVVDFRAVRPTITRLRAENPDSSVVVKVDGKARTKFVIHAVDGIRAANIMLPAISISNG